MRQTLLSTALLPKSILAIALATTTGSVVAQDASFEIYGFAQFDYIQDFNRVDPDWEATLRPSRIPTQDGQFGSDGQAILSARQSRFGVKADTPVDGDTMTAVFEFDLYGVGEDQGQTTMRVRHAYGQWRNFLAGQTNTLFMDGDLFPNVIDYWGPSGMVYLRNPQIRWTPVSDDNMTIAVALEKPGNDVDTGQFGDIDPTLTVQGDQPIPDITGQIRLNQTWGHIQIAGILRQVAYDSPGAPNNDPSGEEVGWGINVSSNIKFSDDTLRIGLVHGNGIASYMNDGGTDLAPDSADGDPAKAVPLTGFIAYYDHYWKRNWSTSFGYSFTEVDNQALQTGNAFKKGEYASVNLLHTPSDNMLAGVELLWGQRTDNNDDSGSDTRIQFTMKYSFSSIN